MTFPGVLTRGDRLVEGAANRLQRLANQFATEGGTKARFADGLAQDAAFVRKLKPSLMAARYRGEAPTNQPPGDDVEAQAPSGPQLPPRPKQKRAGGPNPFVVVGIALVAGIAFAKLIDWRGRAKPGD